MKLNAGDRARLLVTGGAGFVGSHLVRLLLSQGRPVVVYDNFRAGRRESLASTSDLLSVYDGDVRDHQSLRDAVQLYRPRAVIHLAALHYIPYCSSHPVETLEVNVVGTQVVLEACRDADVRRFVFVSSAAVYAPGDRAHKEDDALGPSDIYGLSKLFGEQLIHQFHGATGITSYIARLFNVYGPGETNPHVIPEIVEQLGRGDRLELGNTSARRDLVHARDVARALVCLLENETPPIGVFNVGTGRETSVDEVIDLMEAELGRAIQVEHSPARMRPVDRPHLRADASLMRDKLGWRPTISLRQGLRELLKVAGVAAGSRQAAGSEGGPC